jgi:hypothetical protein
MSACDMVSDINSENLLMFLVFVYSFHQLRLKGDACLG